MASITPSILLSFPTDPLVISTARDDVAKSFFVVVVVEENNTMAETRNRTTEALTSSPPCLQSTVRWTNVNTTEVCFYGLLVVHDIY